MSLAAYLERLHARCWNALCAEMESEPYSAERVHLARRAIRLSRLREAVNVRLMAVDFIPFRSADDQAEAAFVVEDIAYRAAPTCQCGNPKDSGEIMCARCGQFERLDEGRDHDEEAHQARLLKCLPDGIHTASELAEYLS